MEKKQPEPKTFNLKYLIFIAFGLLAFILFQGTLLKILLIPSLFILGSISTFYKRFTRASIGIELITFVTLFYALSIGPLFALIASVLMVLTAAVVSNRLCIPTLIQVICYTLTIIITLPFLSISAIAYGIIFIVLFNVLLHSAYVFIMSFEPTNSIMSFIVNIALNLFLINNFLISLIP
ncbi:hypothetical protein CMO89_03655 [Candidatus Woesearchaeota archaeon]|nr:hypothetical protein [Candidatus Woesearchaeota archaeon]|tara:strand:+ start:4323 stop:4862 length:540 start_codon:yes stop_codon:yes gene_type:complete